MVPAVQGRDARYRRGSEGHRSGEVHRGRDPGRQGRLGQISRKSIDIEYTIGFDEENTVSGGYSPVGLPASYIISSEGDILERIYGSLTEGEIGEKLEGWFGA